MANTSSQLDDRSHSEVHPAAREFFVPGRSGGVLLIHGFAGSLFDLRPLGDDFQRTGATVVGLRLPGHGQSTADLHAATAQSWLAAARSALDKFPPDTTPLIVVGESMGGLLAVLLAEDPRVTFLVLLAPPFKVAKERTRAFLSKLLPPQFIQKKPWIPDNEKQKYLDKGSLLEITVKSYREFLKIVALARKTLPGLHKPVLAIFSKQDGQLARASAEALKRGMGGRVEILEFDGPEHHLITGGQAAQVRSAILDYYHRTK